MVVRRHIQLFLTALLLIAASNALGERPDPADSREVIVYTRGIVEIREVRTVSLARSVGEILLPMLPGTIYAGSVTLEILQPKGVSTISLGYAYDQVTVDKLWAARVGQSYECTVDSVEYSGTILRVDDNKIYLEPRDMPGAIRIIEISEIEEKLFTETPTGLVSEPSFRWRYRSGSNGKAKLRLTYLAEGMNWYAEHRVVQSASRMALTSHFIIDNLTGVNFAYDRLTLVAGEIHLADDKRKVDRMNPRAGAFAGADNSRFGNIRRWIVEGPGVLPNGEQTLLPLVSIEGLSLERRYVYDATIFDDRTTLHHEFTVSGKMAEALPAGTVRLYRRESDGEMLFIGEDKIDDTPPGSPLNLTVGTVFDLTAERTRMKEESTPDGGTSQRFRVTLGNSSNEAITVEVFERLFGNWTVASVKVNGIAADPVVVDARTIRFDVNVLSGKTALVEYEIRYSR